MSRLVLFVTPSFPRPSQTFIVSKFLGLLAKGWDIHLVAPESRADDWTYYPELQVPEVKRRIHILPLEEPDATAVWQSMHGLMKSPLSGLRYWQRAWRHNSWRILFDWETHLLSKLAVLKPDLLHFEFKWPALRWMHLKQLLGCRVMVGIRASDFDYTQSADYYNLLWHNADGLHVLGQDLWQRARRLGCPPTLTHRLIPAAIDTNFWDPGVRAHSDTLGSEERPLRLLTVSRLEWTKGIEYAFEVVRELVDQGIHFEYQIIGDGKYADAIQFARQQMGLSSKVQLLGSQTRFIVKDALLWADIFLHTAVLEGFCNAALEAQAMQLPVVCSDADGLPENVANGETGFVLPQRNTQAMVEKIKLLSADPVLRHKMGRAGRRRVQQHFQVTEQISAFDAFYREILAKD